MKILLITMEYPPMQGGVGNYYFNLVQNLSNVEVAVLINEEIPNNKLPISKKFQITNSQFQIFRRIFFYKYFWPKWIKLFFEVRKLVKKEKPDLIWVGQVLPVGTVAFFIKKFLKVPYFASVHGMDIMLPQKSLRKEKLMMRVLKSAVFITANSEFTKKQLLNLEMEDGKIEVVYPCSHVSRNAYHVTDEKINEIRNGLGLQNKQILLTVGRLVERKGQDKVIEAMSQLVKEFPNLMYLIIGNGPEAGNYKFQITNNKLQDKIKIISNVSDEKLPIFYQLADIFIMPARNIAGDVEGFGIVYLEAGSFGLPVIAGRSGGAKESVIDGQNGILVNPESVVEIKDSIKKLLKDDNLRNKLGEQGRIRSAEFKWEVQAEKIIDKINPTPFQHQY